VRTRVLIRFAALVVGLLALPAAAAAQGVEPAAPGPSAAPAAAPSPSEAQPGEAAPTPQEDDPTRTAGGAVASFMSLRHYLTIRELKAVMTPELQTRYEHDSVPFNGKRGRRIAAFEFSEKDLRPAGSASKAVRASRTPGLDGGAAAAGSAPAAYLATVRSLWEDQGEAVELRVESARVLRREDGLWRVGSLEMVSSEPLRFKEAVPGVTALRLLLRAWTRRDPRSARTFMGPEFLKRYQTRPETLDALIAGGTDPRHVAYQILDMTPQGSAVVVAKVKLFETSPGKPAPLGGATHTLRLVKKGPPWLLDAWD